MFSAKFHFIGLWTLLICLIQIAGGAWLRCFKGDLENYVMTPLDKPPQESFISSLDPALPTIIYTFGYRGKVKGPATTAVLSAYIQKKKRNVVLLDWENEARSGILGIPLGYAFSAVPNAKKIGNEMGEALVRLHEAGVNITNIHLMGHSLGAHIMGFAGRRSRESGHIVERITGLDPARALFEGTFSIQSGLDRTCAKFVDIVHSDPGGYGTSNSIGTVDIWPNYETTGTVQPGCPIGNFDTFSPEEFVIPDTDNPQYGPMRSGIQTLRMHLKRLNLCSHDRSWRYYVESIATPTAFPARGAADYNSWFNSSGQTEPIIYLGDLASIRARGNFYLTTNPRPTYAKGMEGLKPDKTPSSRVKKPL